MTETTAAPTAPTAPEEQDTTRANAVIGILIVSAFVMLLNETILSVGLRSLTVDLGVTTTTIQWLTSGFLLTMAVVIPTTGFLLERFSPRQVFLVSMGLFCAGTLIGALAPSFTVLLVGRVVQACGTAVILPLLLTTVMRLVPAHRRGAMMGTVTIVIAFAPALGPTIGGAVLAYLGWRWMFFVVLPLAVLTLIVGAVIVRLRTETRRVPLDPLSVLLSAIGFGGVLYGFSALGEGGGAHVPPWVPIVVGAASLVVFVLRQVRLQRGGRALLDMRPFTYRNFVVPLLIIMLVFMVLLGAGAVLLPLYLQTVLHLDTFTTGLSVLPGGLVLGAMGRPVGWLYDRYGARPLVIPGAVAMAAAMWLFTTIGEGSSLVTVIVVQIVLMIGLGLLMTPLITEPLTVLPGEFYSHGSAILNTLQQLAGAFGTAIFVTVAALGSAAATGTPDGPGMRLAFATGGVVGVVALIGTLFVRRKSTADAESESAAHEPAAPPTPSSPATNGATTNGSAHAPWPTGQQRSGPPRTGQPRAGGARPNGRVLVAGTVSDAAGTGVPSAVVTLVDSAGRQGGRAFTVDGRYQLGVPAAGSWQLVASAPDHAPRADRLTVVDGQREIVHDVRLAPRQAAATARPR